jgi:polyhydroxyalkanoate synthase
LTKTAPLRWKNDGRKPPKRSYRIAAPQAGEDSEQWLNRATKKSGSWWPDWLAWLQTRSGKMVPARTASNRKFPALADAPGTYVLEK